MGCRCTKESVNIENKKFYILKKIADGGFGTIDLVEESKSGKSYALKRVICNSRNEIEKASLENKYYKQLTDNSNIVKLMYDDIVEDKKVDGFILMSVFTYYQNGNLQNELDINIKQTKQIKLDRLVKLFLGICNGLSYIHESNLAHRDLKPQNILISDDGYTAVLTDFGSMTDRLIEINTSRKSQEISDWAAQNCSMYYKAPELFMPRVGQTINEKADIWSLGCILFSIMYNKGPFDYVAEKGDSIALAVANAKYMIPSHIIQRPEYLVNIVKNSIIFESSNRIALNKIIEDLNLVNSFDSKESNIDII